MVYTSHGNDEMDNGASCCFIHMIELLGNSTIYPLVN